ncbi:hypothetical protein PUN28_014442 [Cardiocondyla obscurior]|uniref:Uncharacterized protein n=1 Tax=Cardiocondyla obscurior TaxID=286306 RepID=A0AAW2F1S8_9HYME
MDDITPLIYVKKKKKNERKNEEVSTLEQELVKINLHFTSGGNLRIYSRHETTTVNGRRHLRRHGENKTGRSGGSGRAKEEERKQKESIVTMRLNFMNIIFQQMSWTIGRRTRAQRRVRGTPGDKEPVGRQRETADGGRTATDNAAELCRNDWVVLKPGSRH